MSARTGKGSPMQAHKVYWRIEPFHVASPRVSADLNFRIVEVRKLLRTDLSIAAIADQLGVGLGILTGFIKRRNLCNLSDRRAFISMQTSLAKLPEEIA